MRIAIVAGVRTPFVRAAGLFRDLSAIELGQFAVRELLARADLPGSDVDHLIFGTVVHDTQAPNIAREIGLATLPKTVPAVTVSRACASSNQAITDGVNLIGQGYAGVVVAGGAESLSHIPITVSERFSRALVGASKARTLKGRFSALSTVRARDLVPFAPEFADPRTC